MNGPQGRLTVLASSLSRIAGGLFDAVRNLAIAVERERRYSVSVVGLRDAETDHDRESWNEVRTEAFNVCGPNGFGYAPKLSRALNDSDPNILHVHGLWMYPSVAATQWSDGAKPYIVSPHGMLTPLALSYSRLKKRIAAPLYENRHLRGASCLHALNMAEAKAIRAYGLRNPICVIPNGVMLPANEISRKSSGARSLLYLGRLNPIKGIPKLIEAWSLVRLEAERCGWRLTIAGWDQGGHRGELENLVAKHQLRSSLDLIGPQFDEAKAECFKRAGAFILPSLGEAMPVTVLEAWSWRLPVLMTKQSNIPEGASAGAAIVMEPDADSIAAALRQLFSMSDAEREAMGDNGRRLVEERFAWPRIGRQMADVYDWVLGGPMPGTVEVMA